VSQATELLLVLVLAGSLAAAGWLLTTDPRSARRRTLPPGRPAAARSHVLDCAPVAPRPAAGRSSGGAASPGQATATVETSVTQAALLRAPAPAPVTRHAARGGAAPGGSRRNVSAAARIARRGETPVARQR